MSHYEHSYAPMEMLAVPQSSGSFHMDMSNASHNGSFRYSWNPYSTEPHSPMRFHSCPHGGSAASWISSEEQSDFTMSEADAEEDDDTCYALGMIGSLRDEPTDAAVQQTMSRLPPRTHLMLLSALEKNEQLLMELMEAERGNVVAQLIGVIGGDNCTKLIEVVVSHSRRLSLNQSGCIAIGRIYDVATEKQRLLICTEIRKNLPDLISHQYGNYVIQAILKSGDMSMFEAVLEYLTLPGVLAEVCINKFGSHVSETFVKNSSSAMAAILCNALLRNDELVAVLAADRFGNYLIQNALRRVQTIPSCSELTQHCMSHIPGLVAESQYALNINRALGLVPHCSNKKPRQQRR